MGHETAKPGSPWLKIGLALLPIAAAGFVAWGSMRSEVDGLRKDLDGKASREAVDATNQAILRELNSITTQLADVRRLLEQRNPSRRP